jgi:hypothetical protein
MNETEARAAAAAKVGICPTCGRSARKGAGTHTFNLKSTCAGVVP